MTSDDAQPQKRYIPDTKEVDIDRAVYDRFQSKGVNVFFKVEADTPADIPEATEELYSWIQQAPARRHDGSEFVHHMYTQTTDPQSGKITLELELIYKYPAAAASPEHAS